MKQKLLINEVGHLMFCLLLLLFAIDSWGQNAQSDGYLINGTIKGIDSGTIRILSNDNNIILDSSMIRKNKFLLQGKINTPQRLVFNISPGNWNFKAFVENNTIELFIDTTGAEHYGNGNNKWSLIWEIDERGSGLSDVFTQYNNETNQKYYISVTSSLQKKLKAFKNDTVAAAKITDEIDSVLHIIYTAQKAWIENYICKNPSSIVSVYLFYDYYQSLADIQSSYLDSILNIFQGQAKSSLYYKELFNNALNLRNIQANNLAPDFILLQRNKSAFKLSSKKGNYIMIDFWASWCAPCRKAIPVWKEIYSKYKNKGLLIVSISDDREWTDWIKALDKEQMPWIQLIDKFPDKNNSAIVAEKFGVKTLPFYVLIDKEGRVITSSGEQDVIKEKIEEVLQ